MNPRGEEVEIASAGYGKRLFALPTGVGCGGIKVEEGVRFRFAGEGGWVVSLVDLEAFVELAKASRT